MPARWLNLKEKKEREELLLSLLLLDVGQDACLVPRSAKAARCRDGRVGHGPRRRCGVCCVCVCAFVLTM